MKRVIAVLTLIALFVPVSIALARGNHRFAIDQQWKRVEACQKRGNERFKKLERDAEPMQRDTGSDQRHDPSRAFRWSPMAASLTTVRIDFGGRYSDEAVPHGGFAVVETGSILCTPYR